MSSSGAEGEGDTEDWAVVVDGGTGVIKAGFAGDDAPKLIFRNVVGTPKSQQEPVVADVHQKEFYIGDEVLSKLDHLNLHRPMDRGMVTSWDLMERVWERVFSGLGVDPRDQPVLVSDPPLNPHSNREKMAQMMFEKFDVPGFSVVSQGVLSQTGSGRHSSVMLDIGEGLTHVTPVEGLQLWPHAVQRANFGGCDLTNYLQQLLNETGYSLSDSAGLESVREAKESLCYVAEDFDSELQTSASHPYRLHKDFTLPSGQSLTLSHHRFRVPEALFKPPLVGLPHDGIHEMVHNCLMQCDPDSRPDFFVTIFLCGGSSMFPGLGDRLQKEMKMLLPSTMRVKVLQPQERKYSVWIGGSILASLQMFRSVWITRQQYQEFGPTIVHRKCS